MARLTDRQLQEKTAEFRERLAEGETLDDLFTGSICSCAGS